MRWFRVLRARLRALVHRDVVAGEIREELEFHVRMRAEEFERGGATHDEARRQARGRVGNLAVLQDRGYDVRGGGLMETVLQDVRYAIRLLGRQRGFALAAILTLALGIGLSTALASVIDSALLRPMPYPHPEQIVSVYLAEPPVAGGQPRRYGPSVNDARAMATDGRVFSDVAVWRTLYPGTIVDGDTPQSLRTFEISEGLLPLYGVTPEVGRGITLDDTREGAPPVVLLGFDYWQQRYAGRRDIIGQMVTFDVGSATVVGVLPAAFHRTTALWRPLVGTAFVLSTRGLGTSIEARLRPGLSLDQAQRELTSLLGRLPDVKPGWTVSLRSQLHSTTASYETTVQILSGAVGAILLIACVNVAGLLIARGTTRAPELAVRASIGAGRGRLVRQLLTESLVLALAGAGVGVLLAWWSLDALVANLPISLPGDAPATINPRVLAASLGVAAVTSLIFGLLPAWRLSRTTVSAVLTHGTRAGGSSFSRRGGQALIGIEVALAVVLLAGAALMIRSFVRLSSVDLGFDPNAIVTVETTTVDAAPSTIGQYYPALVEAIRVLPGVAAAGAINHMPLLGSSSYTSATADTGQSYNMIVRLVLPGYFEAMGQPMHAGRVPVEADRAGRPAIVINQLAAAQMFPGASALGRTMTMGKITFEIIAVVADVRFNGAERDPAPEAYGLLTAQTIGWMHPRALTVVVRPAAGAPPMFDRLRQIAQTIGPRVIVSRVRTSADALGDWNITAWRRTVLLGLLGGLGLVLAFVGVFGMTAYAVGRRTREIGVRMAFGAKPGDVVRAILRDSALPVALGLAVGLGGAMMATRVIATFLFKTTPTDPMTFAAAAATLATAGCLAAWIPARRAARVDPVQALRME